MRISDWSSDVCSSDLIGIGTIPEAELAAAAGVRCGDGIFVNEFCETSISGIFAAGDVARRFDTNQGIDERLETWQNAQDQAVAAENGRASCRERVCQSV